MPEISWHVIDREWLAEDKHETVFCSWCYVAHLHITHLKHEDSYLMHSTFLHLSSCPFTCLCLALLREAPRCLTARSLAKLSLPFTMSSKKRKKKERTKGWERLWLNFSLEFPNPIVLASQRPDDAVIFELLVLQSAGRCVVWLKTKQHPSVRRRASWFPLIG